VPYLEAALENARDHEKRSHTSDFKEAKPVNQAWGEALPLTNGDVAEVEQARRRTERALEAGQLQ